MFVIAFSFLLIFCTFVSIDSQAASFGSVSDDGMILSADGKEISSCRIVTDGTIDIPKGVETIDDYAFFMCEGNTGEIYIPASVTSIGLGAFAGCSGTYFVVDKSNSQYSSVDGFLMTKDGKTLISCLADRTGNVAIPSCVETVGYLAFYKCTGLDGYLSIPSNVKTIEDYAFAYCTGVKYIDFRCGTDTIFGNDVFKGISFKDSSGDDVELNATNLCGNHFAGKNAMLVANADYPSEPQDVDESFFLYIVLVGILFSTLAIVYNFRKTVFK